MAQTSRPAQLPGDEPTPTGSTKKSERLPAKDLYRVTAEHVWNAVEKLRDPRLEHPFGLSTDYDLVTNEGERFPPKAVFGLAASEILGFAVQPKHFSGGIGTPCFRVLQVAGFTIVPKDEAVPTISIPTSEEDREWTEGKSELAAHLRKERASGLAQAKKDQFVRLYGRLTCERCGMDPVEVYGGPHGVACIEVHHHSVQVENMAETHQTKLEDLKCLCANCHRVVHRLLKLEIDDPGPITTNSKSLAAPALDRAAAGARPRPRRRSLLDQESATVVYQTNSVRGDPTPPVAFDDL